MQTYHVQVRNELTGEIRVVEVRSGHAADAQVEALQRLFKSDRWRRAVALPPQAAPGTT